ncbi:hypothetical protein DP181_24805, partial [Enterobacter kobei]
MSQISHSVGIPLIVSDTIKAELGQVDVVIGGPPCQGFSSADRQK